MANVIGSLFVELNLNSAQFADGVNKANATTKQLGDGLKKFGEQSNYSMLEARHGVMLLGEEFGVHMPRAVSTLIASIGPVGSVLAAAFPVLGAIAFVEIIAKAIEHFNKAKEAAAAFAIQEQDVQNKAELATQSLELENLKLDDQLAKIRGGAPKNEMAEQILEINKRAGELAATLTKDNEKLNEVLAGSTLGSRLKEIGALLVSNVGELSNFTASTKNVDGALSNARNSLRSLAAAEAEMDSMPTVENQKKYAAALLATQQELQRSTATLRQFPAESSAAQVDFLTKKVEELGGAYKQLQLIQENVAKQAAIKKAESPLTAIDKEQGEIILAQMKELAHATQLQIEYDNLMAGGLRQEDADLSKLTFDMKAYDKELALANEINNKATGTLAQYAATVQMVDDLVKKGIVTQQDADAWLRKYGQDIGVIATQATTSTKAMDDLFKQVASDFAKDFAQAVTSGKGSISEFFKSFDEQITKLLVSKALDDLLGKLAGLFGGGSSTGGTTGGGGFGDILKGIFGGGLFGGGKAEGGPVAPGVAYLVGEEGQEMFIPRTAGTIVPNGGTIPSTPMHANVNIHVHGASDPDTFRKATPQIMADAYRHLQIAHAHNGRG